MRPTRASACVPRGPSTRVGRARSLDSGSTDADLSEDCRVEALELVDYD
jgi:hypothetical protein